MKFSLQPWYACFIGCIFLLQQTQGQIPFIRSVNFTLNEYQPNIRWNGRINSISIDPADTNKVIVASESGGIFRSTNRGTTWQHIDALPNNYTHIVKYVNTSTVLATTGRDFKINTTGGIWRSTNGGLSWIQRSIPVPTSFPRPDLFEAYDISIDDSGKIFVSTSGGYISSTDNGNTWTYRSVDVAAEFYSVIAFSSTRIILGGNTGIWYSTDGGTTWNREATSIGTVQDLHALGVAPNLGAGTRTVYVVTSDTRLHYSENGGRNWTNIASAPGGGGGCGGITFVRAVRSGATSIRLYFGNRCGMSNLNCSRVAGSVSPYRFNYSGTWGSNNSDHGDTRDVAFTRTTYPIPRFLATDGGFHKTRDRGANFTGIGAGSTGLNAMQLTEIAGQKIGARANYDLYIGSQDISNWSSNNYGATWGSEHCCEGFFFEMERTVPTVSDSRINWVSCAGCDNFVSGPNFVGISLWNDPPDGWNPFLVQRNVYVEKWNATTAHPQGFAITTNGGSTWARLANIALPMYGTPKVTRTTSASHLYQGIRVGYDAITGQERVHIARVNNVHPATGTSVQYPTMTNFMGIGVMPTMFAWYEVFAANPQNPSQIIAADVLDNKMKMSIDGGNNWTEMPSLTDLVTESGTVRFRLPNSRFPIVSHISFNPEYPNYILVGTFHTGLFFSYDGGNSWLTVPGSKGVTNATKVYWKSTNEALISSYGRGLWKLQMSYRYWFEDLARYRFCPEPCLRFRFPRPEPDPLPFDEVWKGDRFLYLTDGFLTDINITPNGIQNITVLPGSNVMEFGPKNANLRSIPVVESSKVGGFSKNEYLNAILKKGYKITGIVAEGPKITEVFVSKEISPNKEVNLAKDFEMKGNQELPEQTGPSIQLVSDSLGKGGGVLFLSPNIKSITIQGSNFLPTSEAPIEVLLDDKVVLKEGNAPNGSFKIELRLNLPIGRHHLRVQQVHKQQILADGFDFVIKHADGRKQ